MSILLLGPNLLSPDLDISHVLMKLLVLAAHRLVDVAEDVALYHDGDGEEDGVTAQTDGTQLTV